MTNLSLLPVRATVPKPKRSRRRRKLMGAPVALQPIPWGKPDPALAMLVCRWIEEATAWRYARSNHIGSMMGWGCVGLVALAILGAAGAR